MSVIIFDFDGTIVDSRNYFIDFIAKRANKYPLNKEQKENLHGLPLMGVARALDIPWYRLPRLYFQGRKQMDVVIRDLQPFSEMPNVIKKLHNEGHELFIVSSNSVRNIRLFLKHQNLREQFMEIYGGIEMFGKASMMHRLLRENNLKVKQSISIGDEVRDIEAAQSIGMRTVAVTWGFARLTDLESLNPTAIANKPLELMDILEEM